MSPLDVEGEEFRRAMERALTLLKFRGRSEAELTDRLRAKRVPAPMAAAVTARLRELGLVDDAALARTQVETRRRGAQGDHRIRRDLLHRGLSRDAVEAALALPPETPPEERLESLVRRWAPAARKDPRRGRRRLEGRLLRRGFDAEDVRTALKRIFGPTDKGGNEEP